MIASLHHAGISAESDPAQNGSWSARWAYLAAAPQSFLSFVTEPGRHR